MHTKGPWEWQVNLDKHIVIFNGDGDIVVRDGEYLMEGDARLIAAAPELLEALEMLLNETNAGMWDCLPVDKANEAIHKAKGE